MTQTIYTMHAAKYIEIDQDEQGLFCTIPSEQDFNKRYELRCEESTCSVVVKSCGCRGFQQHNHCKHSDVCQAYWDNLYKHNTPENTTKYQRRINEASSPIAPTTPPAVSSSPTSYTMSDALYSKLASLNENKPTKSDEAKKDDEKTEHLEEVYAELRELSGKTLRVLMEGSTGIEMLRKHHNTSVLNDPQRSAKLLMDLPSRQQKQQEAMAS